jgi:hypothetical protein
MQDIDGIAAQPIENTEWVANDGGDADPRTLRNARSGLG